jgi:hypothetical protein
MEMEQIEKKKLAQAKVLSGTDIIGGSDNGW